jgi:glycosyltransferase involved in cell wall biosynthesis
MKYSVIVPIHNETTLLLPLAEDLCGTFDSLGLEQGQFEIIFVDGGSNQRTRESLSEVIAHCSVSSAICLRREISLSLALSTGFIATQGEKIITITGNLKGDIRSLLLKLDEKLNTEQDGVIGRTDKGMQVGIYQRHVLNRLKIYGQFFEHLPLLAKNQGFHIEHVGIDDHFVWPKIKTSIDILSLTFIQRFGVAPRYLFMPAGALCLLASIAFGSLAIFGISLNIIFMGLISELVLHQAVVSNIEVLLRNEIESIMGTEYAKRKITYGLTNQMQQAS